MLNAFNQIYGAFKGFLSQDFWYTIFVPLALFSFVHFLLLSRFTTVADLETQWTGTGATARLTAGLAGLVLLGYMLQSFLPMMRGLLDGSLLPAWLHDGMRRDRLAQAGLVRDRIWDAQQLIGTVQQAKLRYDDPASAIAAARTAGRATPGAVDQASVQALQTAVSGLAGALDLGEPIAEPLAAAENALIQALSVNDDAAPAATALQQSDARYNYLLPLLEAEATYRWQVEQVRYRVASDVPPWATMLGDARFAVERYSLDVYAVNFEFIWPRLVLAMQADAKDDPCLAAVGAARARVDFAMVCLMLAATVPLVWLPAVVALDGPGWLIPAIGGATPLAFKLFYGMAVEGQLAFGDTVKTTIDKHRFLVLKLLRLANPATRAEERGLWTRIRSAEEDGRATQLVYTSGGTTP